MPHVSVNTSSAPILEKFPVLCRLIYRKTITRKKARIRRLRKLVRRALQQDSPPTLRALANRLGYKDKKVLTRYFPELHAELIRLRRASQAKRLTELKGQLRYWLQVEPPVSLARVCRELALPSSTVARKCPEECKAMALRRSRKRRSVLRPES